MLSADEVIKVFKAHARILAGGYHFSVMNSGSRSDVQAILSDDYFYDSKLGGTRLSMLYDDSTKEFRLSAWREDFGFTSPKIKLEDPENIGSEMDLFLHHVKASTESKYVRLRDKKRKQRFPLKLKFRR